MQLIKVDDSNSEGYKEGLIFQDKEWGKRDKERGFKDPGAKELVFNVVENGSIVASSKVKIWGEVFQIQSFIVGSDFRGKGLGKFLLESLIDDAKKMACKSMYVSTLSINEESIQMYKKYDFLTGAVIKDTFFGHDLVVLQKRLS